MKKILIIFALLIICVNFAAAGERIEFIYINGSNNNDIKMTKWFYKGISNFHPVLRKTLLEDEFTYNYLLKNGKYDVAIEPQILFWGDYSKNNLTDLKEDLSIMNKYSPRIAQRVRELFAYCIYDAIWVSKYVNMYPILEELHGKIMNNYKKGNQTVILGYSAGTFITYSYFLERLPAITKENFLNLVEIKGENKKIYDKYNFQDTCVLALERTGFITNSTDRESLLYESPSLFERKIKQLDSYTKTSCAPKGSIKAVINYASPLPLFFDDLNDPEHKLSILKTYVYKYAIENDLFYLTVNFAEDPMGYPLGSNLSLREIYEQYGITLDAKGGFFYDKSNLKSAHTFILAHTSYWRNPKTFAKGILDAYKTGYKYFYSLP